LPRGDSLRIVRVLAPRIADAVQVKPVDRIAGGNVFEHRQVVLMDASDTWTSQDIIEADDGILPAISHRRGNAVYPHVGAPRWVVKHRCGVVGGKVPIWVFRGRVRRRAPSTLPYAERIHVGVELQAACVGGLDGNGQWIPARVATEILDA